MSLLDGFEHIVREGESLAPYTFFRLGGIAEYFAEPTSVDELSRLCKRFREAGHPIRVIGAGSNILVKDGGVPGLVVQLNSPALCQLEILPPRIKVGSGVKLTHLIAATVAEGLKGLESLVGIPGTVGGALCTNASTNNADIGQFVVEATTLDRAGEIKTLDKSQLTFGYKKSNLRDHVILNASFELESDDPQTLTRRMQKQWIVKKSSHPATSQRVGYIFKDAGGLTADKLIDQAGLKGTRIGEAVISDRDANFIVCNPGTKTEDVLRLIDLVKSQVQDRCDVELELSLEIW